MNYFVCHIFWHFRIFLYSITDSYWSFFFIKFLASCWWCFFKCIKQNSTIVVICASWLSKLSLLVAGSVQSPRTQREWLQVRHDKSLLPTREVCRVWPGDEVRPWESRETHRESEALADLFSLEEGTVWSVVCYQMWVDQCFVFIIALVCASLARVS